MNGRNFAAGLARIKQIAGSDRKSLSCYDDNNNILTIPFCIFISVPGNWSGSFRLNDFDGWQEKGSSFGSEETLRKTFFLCRHLSNSKHLSRLFVKAEVLSLRNAGLHYGGLKADGREAELKFICTTTTSITIVSFFFLKFCRLAAMVVAALTIALLIFLVYMSVEADKIPAATSPAISITSEILWMSPVVMSDFRLSD